MSKKYNTIKELTIGIEQLMKDLVQKGESIGVIVSVVNMGNDAIATGCVTGGPADAAALGAIGAHIGREIKTNAQNYGEPLKSGLQWAAKHSHKGTKAFSRDTIDEIEEYAEREEVALAAAVKPTRIVH